MRSLMSGSTSASLDGAIGQTIRHATLNPQGDHSRTQLVLTKQSLNFTDLIPSSSLYLATVKVLCSVLNIFVLKYCNFLTSEVTLSYY